MKSIFKTYLIKSILNKNQIRTHNIIPARLAFQKNSELILDIYWLGTVPAGIVGASYSSVSAIKDFNTSDKQIRRMYGTVMGLIGFGAGVSAWMLWPLIIPVGVGTYAYDKYYYKENK
jgi:hypothetical protein